MEHPPNNDHESPRLRAPAPPEPEPRWTALPTPGRLVRLPLGCPSQLVELAGHYCAGRLVAIWWTPLGDEVTFSDGAVTVTGDDRGWLRFCAHPLGRLLLRHYRLGSAGQVAENWLLVDRQLATLDVGVARDVRALLATQPSELDALTAELSSTEAATLFAGAVDSSAAWQRENARHEREQELLGELEELLHEGLRTVIELVERHDQR